MEVIGSGYGWPAEAEPVAERKAIEVQTLDYADSAADALSTDRAVRVEKPAFVGWAAVARPLPDAMFLGLWCGQFLGILALLGFHASGLNGVVPPEAVALCFVGPVLVAIPTLAYVIGRAAANREYRLYADRAEVVGGGGPRASRQWVAYRDVLRVVLIRGPAQRQCGLGTVRLVTKTGPRRNRAGAVGLDLADVANLDELYLLVQHRVTGARTAAGRPNPARTPRDS